MKINAGAGVVIVKTNKRDEEKKYWKIFDQNHILTDTEAEKLLFSFAPRWAINLVGQSSSRLCLRKQYLSICNNGQRNNVSFGFAN